MDVRKTFIKLLSLVPPFRHAMLTFVAKLNAFCKFNYYVCPIRILKKQKCWGDPGLWNLESSLACRKTELMIAFLEMLGAFVPVKCSLSCHSCGWGCRARRQDCLSESA